MIFSQCLFPFLSQLKTLFYCCEKVMPLKWSGVSLIVYAAEGTVGGGGKACVTENQFPLRCASAFRRLKTDPSPAL